jgi:hypothetical protein
MVFQKVALSNNKTFISGKEYLLLGDDTAPNFQFEDLE